MEEEILMDIVEEETEDGEVRTGLNCHIAARCMVHAAL